MVRDLDVEVSGFDHGMAQGRNWHGSLNNAVQSTLREGI
jgi:hypothetical protein